MLFAEVAETKMSGSKVPDGLIRDSNSEEMKAGPSNVDGVYPDSVKPSTGGNCLNGSNDCDTIIGKMRELKCNESMYRNKRRFLALT